IAGTTARFNEREKYILDHYLMSGGRILWLLDGVFLSRDELRRNAQTPAIKNETNLDDLLFTYGVRINPALVQDVQCAPVLLASDNGQYTTVPNYYSILLLPSNNQPVTKDISPVKAEFASPIDILAHSSDVEINVLLSSSMQSHVVPVPEQITLLSPEISISSDYFDKSFLPTAVALHGKFQSAFKNRLIPDSIITDGKTPLFQSQPTKIVVVSSSDIIRNEVIGAGTQSHILPMGYDRISDRQYGNRQFIANVVNWLVNDDEWLSLRAKQQHIRLLNRQLIYSDRQRYAWINILVPLVFVCVIVGGYHFYRKRKYEKN
ncbi:MAG: Gldg family protein, partial [Prevotella sp.]|nr:Gldg family protein [Prevotella sp.]